LASSMIRLTIMISTFILCQVLLSKSKGKCKIMRVHHDMVIPIWPNLGMQLSGNNSFKSLFLHILGQHSVNQYDVLISDFHMLWYKYLETNSLSEYIWQIIQLIHTSF
jgi:hypothetical protein